MPSSNSLTIRPLGQIVQALTRYGQNLFKPPDDTIRGVEPDTWYSPLQPVKPVGPQGVEPRGFQYYAGQNLLWTPRADAEYSAADLKQLATYPLARIAIENVKDAICKASWQIQMRPEPGESRKAATKRGLGDSALLKLNRFFEMPDREHVWPEWLRPFLDDMLVIDAWTILIRRTFSGEIVEMPTLRGDSIVRYIDENGFTPMPPQPAYAQLWWGLPLVNLSTDQLIYKPRNIVPRNTIASQLYGMSPTEQLATEIQVGMRRLEFVLAYYTEGSTPGVVQVVPKGTTDKRIAEAMQWMNSELAGNLAARRQWRLIQGFNEPGKDEQIIFTKEPLLSDMFDEQHTRRIAFGYGISPQRLMRQMNRASSQQADEAAEVEGLLPYFSSLKGVIDFIIQRRFNYANYEMVFSPLSEPDPAKQAETIKVYVSGAVMTPNEGRERIGEEARPEPEADMLGVVTASGFVPIGGSGALTTPGDPKPLPGKGNDGVSPEGKNGKTPAAGASGKAGDESGDGEEDGDGQQRTNADGRGTPRKPAGANKPNGNKAALEARTANRPIGFASGAVEALEAPQPVYGYLEIDSERSQATRSAFARLAKAKKLATRPIAIRPDRLTPDTILSRGELSGILRRAFGDMKRKTTKILADRLGLPHAHLAKTAADDATDAILKALADDWKAVADAAEAPLGTAWEQGVSEAGLQLSISDADMLAGINEVARSHARARAAELVGMRRAPDGTLYENPDARWAIEETTRERIQTIVTDLFAQPEAERTLRGVEERINASGQLGPFADSRASMIARTEITFAQTQGNLLGWRESGLVTKVSVVLSADHDKDDECDEIAGESPYAIDEVPEIPAHPYCVCAMVLKEWADETTEETPEPTPPKPEPTPAPEPIPEPKPEPKPVLTTEEVVEKEFAAAWRRGMGKKAKMPRGLRRAMDDIIERKVDPELLDKIRLSKIRTGQRTRPNEAAHYSIKTRELVYSKENSWAQREPPATRHEYGHAIDFQTDTASARRKFGWDEKEFKAGVRGMLREYLDSAKKIELISGVPMSKAPWYERKQFADSFDDAIYNEKLERAVDRLDWVRKTVIQSKLPTRLYAITNSREWFAESFDVYLEGGNKAQRLARDFPETYKHIFNMTTGGYVPEES